MNYKCVSIISSGGDMMIDITRPIRTNMTVWPGDDGVLVKRVRSISKESASNVSRVEAGVHIGTHVDAPLHFIPDGKSIDQLDINLFTGTVKVIDTGNEDIITRKMLPDVINSKAVFFKTWYSDRSLDEPFDTNYTGLSLDAAQHLIESGVKVIGIDTLSIEKYKSGNYDVHKTLLGKEILIIEGLCLKGVSSGEYNYICMPLCIEGSDGSPARVMLY
jgi:arylformamidase